MYPRAEGKGDREKSCWTYHFLPNEASSDGPVITHTQQQFWKPGDLEQEHVLERGEGGGRKAEGDGGGGDGKEGQVQKVGGRTWERGRQRWTGRGRCRKGVGGGQGGRWWEGKMRQQQMHYESIILIARVQWDNCQPNPNLHGAYMSQIFHLCILKSTVARHCTVCSQWCLNFHRWNLRGWLLICKNVSITPYKHDSAYSISTYVQSPTAHNGDWNGEKLHALTRCIHPQTLPQRMYRCGH